MKTDALMIREADNVATALRDIRAGEVAVVGDGDKGRKIRVREAIPFGHKFAVHDIAQGEPVLKYGEVIGRATAMIPVGAHAHVQNIESLRGRGDWPSGGD